MYLTTIHLYEAIRCGELAYDTMLSFTIYKNL